MNILSHQTNQPILFYSNFSNSSRIFLDLVTQYNLDKYIKFICIDHKKFRDKLKRSSILKIDKVPCLLKLYEQGTVEKYDDKAVFEWLGNLIDATTPQEEIHNEVDDEDEDEDIPPVKSTPVKKKTKKPKNLKMTETESEKTTSILELLSDEDEDVETSEEDNSEPLKIKKPVTSIRTNSGNYDFEDFGDHKVQDNPNNLKGVKKNTETASKQDIISLAQSMQKSRELEDSKNVIPGHVSLEKSRHKT